MIVDLSVTVVVFAVTNFGLWRDFTLTGTPSEIGETDLCTGATFAYTERGHGSHVTRTGESRLGAWTPASFINFSVAIIIEFVVAAAFVYFVGIVAVSGIIGGATINPTKFTLARFAGTLAYPLLERADGCNRLQVFDLVNLTITIVVDTVALFWSWKHLSVAFGFPAPIWATNLNACFAGRRPLLVIHGGL